jgi:hypothetical protein
MAGPLVRWADASEYLNNSRSDVPPVYVLRLTKAACADLGIDHPEADDDFESLPPLIQKFADHYENAAAIDAGTPFAAMPGKGLFRIKRNEWRGLVWADRAAGVMWLCRAVVLADYAHEDLAYDELARAGEQVLPTDDERESAEEERVLVHALWAMRDAMREAHDAPDTWHDARILGAGQVQEDGEIIGRAYVEQIKEDGDELKVRCLIAVTKPPVSIVSAEEWIELVMTRIFPPQGGDVLPMNHNDLPGHPDFHPGVEVALFQDAY